MTAENKPTIVPIENPADEAPMSIAKPRKSTLDMFKSSRDPNIAGVETLLTALPHHNLTDAKDWTRLHPDEENYWSAELCFVIVPIKGQKDDILHLINEDLAKRYLPSIASSAFAWRSQQSHMTSSSFARYRRKTWTTRGTKQACVLACRPRQNGHRQPAANTKAPRVTRSPTPATRMLPGTKMAETEPRRADPGDLHRPHDRQRRPPRSVAADRGEAVADMSENFSSIVVCDFEYEIASGGLPDVLCMVAYVLDENLRHVRTIRQWRGEFGTTPPFDVGPDTLFVAYSAWAEMTCFQVLGWQFPGPHLRPAHRLSGGQQHAVASQSRREAEKAAQTLVRCLPRLRHRRLGEHRQGNNQPKRSAMVRGARNYSPQEVIDYCEEDVRMSVKLLRRQLLDKRGGDVNHVLCWSNYSAKAIA